MGPLFDAIRYYITVSPQEEEIVSRLFTEMQLKAGEYFMREGQICRHVAFVATGIVRYYLNYDGIERTVFFSIYCFICRGQGAVVVTHPKAAGCWW